MSQARVLPSDGSDFNSLASRIHTVERSLAPEPWLPLGPTGTIPYEGSWTNEIFSTTGNLAANRQRQGRISKDAAGNVTAQGVLKRASVANGQTLFILPEGYYSSRLLRFITSAVVGGAATQVILQIDFSFVSALVPDNTIIGNLYLSPINFRADL